ncbi:hypothetical protein K1T71_003626 [Dendrolimus kikuchii]|uniref:Uncharacterized protein n=1 Tax=Dendrolimus kikuchii TaxID=765133 RepID=A0ACC1D9I0_9NEOP|nr:hypothetical protein K1T71_003626 [Dendrolimus kikuchii]
MEKRKLEIENLSCYTRTIENEVTLILQNLQWDPKQFIKGTSMTVCKYDKNHKIPPDSKKTHEEECYLKCEDYTKEDLLFPEPLDCNSSSLVKLSADKISEITNNAAKVDTLFKKGPGSGGTVPLSLERLQCAYSVDERRAIYDAVVKAAPSCHDLTDLALLSADGEKGNRTKSRTEILAELRDMKRRRTKYRVAAKTKNYSDVLRDVIKTQMEVYTESQIEETPSKYQGNNWSNDSGKNKKNSLDDGSRNLLNNKNLNSKSDRSNTGYEQKYYKSSFEEKKKVVADINVKHKRDYKKDDKIRHGDERKYQKEQKYRDKGSSSGYPDSRFSTEKYYEEKVPSSYRDEQSRRDIEEKRYKDGKSSTSKKNVDNDKRKYSDRYYRDEKRLRDDGTPRNKIKRHDEIKKESNDDYKHRSIKMESNKGKGRYTEEEYTRDNKEVSYKRYYALDSAYNDYDDRVQRKKYS